MTERERNQLVLAKHMAAEDAHDLEGTLATIHPDALFEDLPIGLVLRGREETARHYNLWWRAFELQTDAGILHWVSDKLLIGESHFIGNHVGEFLGIAPTGNSIRFPFSVIVKFRDGLLLSEKFYYDLNDIMAQIGQPAFKTAA